MSKYKSAATISRIDYGTKVSYVSRKKKRTEPFQRIILTPNIEKEIDLILIEGLENHYKEYKIPKNTKGFRTICAPSDRLKKLQRNILNRIIPCVAFDKFTQGFTKNKNLMTNACAHKFSIMNIANGMHNLQSGGLRSIDKKVANKQEESFIDISYINNNYSETSKLLKSNTPESAIRIDLKDAFGSITTKILRDGLIRIKTLNYVLDPIESIAKVMKICLHRGSLPQGAPTSPIMLNIALAELDEYANRTLSSLALAKYNEIITYTRYADDIVISSNGDSCNRLIPVMRGVIEHFGLKVNNKKTRIMSHKTGLFITGINLVNSSTHVSISRKRRDKIRAAIYKASKLTPFTQERVKETRSVLGRISHVTSIDMAHGVKLLLYAKKLGLIDEKVTVNNISPNISTQIYKDNSSLGRRKLFS